MRKLLPLCGVFFLGAMATAASAATYSFDLSGSRSASFTLSSPSSSTAFQSVFTNVNGIFNGQAGTASEINFGVAPLIASLNIVGTSLGFTQFAGSQLFTGPTSNPVFTPGTYQLGSIVSGSSTLTIASVAGAVPEPATWAMMLGGFAMVGVSARRRKRPITTTA